MPAKGTRDLTSLVSHTMVDFNQMKTFARDPLILRKGDGIRVTDIHDREYIDGISGVFAMCLGHSAATVIEAITEQLRTLAFSSPIMSTNDRALELVGELIRLTEGRMQQVKLFGSGSEATEAAMKMARQYHKQTGSPGRYKIFSFYQSYHGGTLGALSATGWPKLKTPYEPMAPGYLHIHAPLCGRRLDEHDHSECGRRTLDDLRRSIVAEDPETVAAVILEPVMLTAGVRIPPAGFLEGVQQICNELGVLLIFDEVVTGFGRLGAWFAAELYGVWPDLMCLGKGISAGYAPLSAVLMTEKVGASFWGEPDENAQFQSGHTHAANPVSAAAGLATIRAFEATGVLANVQRSGRHLATRLAALEEECDQIGEVRGLGLLFGIDFVASRASGGSLPPTAPLATAVQQAARRKGLLLRASPHIATLAPPLVSTIEDVDEIAEIFTESVREVAQEYSRTGGVDVEVGFGL
jgi:adenosylmethionine-8-amino-7-oxononanoate aminotransferase